jgi:hypothetical protein
MIGLDHSLSSPHSHSHFHSHDSRSLPSQQQQGSLLQFQIHLKSEPRQIINDENHNYQRGGDNRNSDSLVIDEEDSLLSPTSSTGGLEEGRTGELGGINGGSGGGTDNPSKKRRRTGTGGTGTGMGFGTGTGTKTVDSSDKRHKYDILGAFFRVFFRLEPGELCGKHIIFTLYTKKIELNFRIARNAMYRHMWSVFRGKLTSIQVGLLFVKFAVR